MEKASASIVTRHKNNKEINWTITVTWTRVLAVCLSWNYSHSIFWAIVHFFFGVLYIPYFFLEDTNLYNFLISYFQ